MSSVGATVGVARRRVAAVQRSFPVLQVGVLIALLFYGSLTINGFILQQSIRSMLVLAALLGLAAAGQTLVMLVGGLDLSIPGLIVLGATMVTNLCGSHGWALGPALALIVVICGGVGATVGWLCHRLRVMPIVVTLAVGTLAIGAMQVWGISYSGGTAPKPLSDATAANGTTFGLAVSPVVIIWAVVAIVLAIVLHRTKAGRRVYATGASPRAAELSLISTRKVWIGVFATSAILSGLVGTLLAGFAGTGATIGQPYLFQGLTAVIVGGTAFMGTRGDYTHTVLGALILTVLTTILVGRGFDSPDQQIIFGALILVVVALYGRERRLEDRI